VTKILIIRLATYFFVLLEIVTIFSFAYGKDRSLYSKKMGMAIKLLTQRKYIEARPILEGIVRQAPHDAMANYRYGRLLLVFPRNTSQPNERKLKKKEIRTAIRHLVLATSQSPKTAIIHFYLGHAFNFDNRKDQAMKSYRRAVELDPQIIEAYYNMGVLYEDRNEQTAARSMFATYLRKKKALQGADSGFDDF